MADFAITINSQPTTSDYVVTASSVFKADSCIAVIDSETPIGLLQNTATTTPEYYMLSSYTDASAWKTLKIKNVVYSHPTNVYLSDTLVKIPEAGGTVYDFVITGQAVDIAIPNLTLTMDTYTPTGSATITFDLAIQNQLDQIGNYTSVTLQIDKKRCIIPLEEILISSVASNTCEIRDIATVIPPIEGERYVVLEANDIFGSEGSSVTAGETITVSTNYTLWINASDVGVPDTYSNVIIKVYNNSSMAILLSSYQIDRAHQGIIC